jgi:hypothetical protein
MGYNTHDLLRQVAIHANARPNAAKAASFNPFSQLQYFLPFYLMGEDAGVSLISTPADFATFELRTT